MPVFPKLVQTLRDGDELALGGREWRVIAGGGHSPELAMLYSADAGALIPGDQVLPTISPNIGVWPGSGDGDPLRSYLSSLERLRALPEDTLVLPAHGQPFRGLRARIAAIVAEHEERLTAIHEACARATTAFEIAVHLWPGPLDRFQTMLAVAESLAHLQHLVELGRLRREVAEDGVVRFRRDGR